MMETEIEKRSLPLSTIFKDHLIYDFAAEHTAPPEKLLTGAVKLFINHDPTAAVTFHDT